ncbi:MAG TPA: SgcJ/EcaC family oxidoreductase [Candidatus Acidoferrales bacterium]|nr:SgcJ/EcaC family oxidoreductase [Candidatus Acidoferrales bacterium]
MPSEKSADIAAIEAIVSAQAEAWNRGDAKAFSARFAEDGSFTNVFGMTFYGHAAFEQRHREFFETVARGTRATMAIAKLRFVRDDVAIADVDCTTSGYAKLPPGVPANSESAVRSCLQLVFVRENGSWWITAFHNTAVTPLPARS